MYGYECVECEGTEDAVMMTPAQARNVMARHGVFPMELRLDGLVWDGFSPLDAGTLARVLGY